MAASALLVAAGLSYADDASAAIRSFTIPPQSLSSALKVFASQAELQLIFTESDVGTGQTSGVKGELAPAAALDEILKGTPLEYEITASNVVVVRKIGTKTSLSFGTKALRLAQSEPASQADNVESSEGAQLEEVIVTAQKREQRAFDIPMSVSVLGESEIHSKGIANLRDFAYAVPGLVVQEDGIGKQQMFMRGIGNINGSDVMVSAYLDEAPITLGDTAGALNSAPMLDVATTDIERIEVLRGPQGTLYGAGAVSGTVRFIAKDPVLDRFGAATDATLSVTDKGDPNQQYNLTLNVPIARDVFGVRIASSYEKWGGWIDQPAAAAENVNGQDRLDVRVKALWKPTESFSARAMVIVHKDDSDVGTSESDASYDFRPAVDPARQEPYRNDVELYNLTLTYDAGFAQLLSTSTYVDQTQHDAYDFKDKGRTLFPTYEGFDANDRISRSFTQEVRLTSSGAGTLSWTAGGYFSDRESRLTITEEDVYGGVFFPSFFDDEWTSSAWAAFGDASYKTTSRLTVGAGLRYFKDERDSTNFANPQSASAKFDATTWRVYGTYDLQDNIKLYTNIGSGFRSGGFGRNLSVPGGTPYEPEYLLSYEVGTKMALFDRRVSLDVALFYSDYKDMLQRALVLVNNSFVILTKNVGDASVKGIDASLSWQLTDRLGLNLSGTYNDGQVDKADINSPAGARPGDPLDYVPKYSFAAGAEYKFEWTARTPGFLRLDFNRRDKVHAIDRGSVPFIQESDQISLLNARLGLERGNWNVQLFAKNLLNEDGSQDPWLDWRDGIRPQPRTIGVRVGAQFD